MKVETHYCDLCNNILNSKRHVVVIVHDDEFTKGKSNYNNANRDVYEVCDSCLFIMTELFKYKASKVLKLKKEVDKIYKITKEK